MKPPRNRAESAADEAARRVMDALDAGARALLAVALATGREPVELVVELRRAARLLEVSYRRHEQAPRGREEPRDLTPGLRRHGVSLADDGE